MNTQAVDIGLQNEYVSRENNNQNEKNDTKTDFEAPCVECETIRKFENCESACKRIGNLVRAQPKPIETNEKQCATNNSTVDRTEDQRVDYNLVGRDRTAYLGSEKKIALETDTPIRLYVTTVKRTVSDNRKPYAIIGTTGNRRIFLNGIRLKTFEEKVRNISSILHRWITITERKHISASGRLYYTVDVAY
jgi:hypothetical protein